MLQNEAKIMVKWKRKTEGWYEVVITVQLFPNSRDLKKKM